MCRILFALPALLFAWVSFSGPAAAADSNAVILMYHRFGEDKYPSTNVRTEQFEAHLEYLENNGFTVRPLEEVVNLLKRSSPIPDKTVVITIDDAYDSVYNVAYPMLKERGWPFTVFVSTDAVDMGFTSIMTWDRMREMSANGATFANHGVSHSSLARPESGETRDEWLKRAREEISTAQKRLVKELGSAPMLFAYPYGEYSRDLAILVAELGFTGLGQQSGAVGPLSDTRALPRFPMAEPYADLQDFALKVKSLAMPVRSVRPWDPVLSSDERRPVLELGLASNDMRRTRLACFVSGQGRVEVDWVDRKSGRFNVRAPEPLSGRSRYNCTAPSKESGRYYWYSHIWIAGN